VSSTSCASPTDRIRLGLHASDTMSGMTSADHHKYRYPDPAENITLTLVDQSELSPELWGEQESSVLAKIDEALRHGRLLTLLDYGSGTGRLAVRYAEIFERVTSFEPDAGRAREQRDFIAMTPLADRIRVIEDLAVADAEYNAVLCSHVIQHVPRAVAERVLQDITGHVEHGGVVVLLTTLSPDKDPHYVLSYVSDAGRAVEDDVSAVEFENAAREDVIGVLPVRFFPLAGLVAELDRLGMDTLGAFGFHGSSGIVGPATEASPELLRCRDVALVTRRR